MFKTNLVRTLLTRLASICVFTLLCSSLGQSQAVFANVPTAPIGVAATPNQLLVSDYTCTAIYSVSTAGKVSTFATFTAPPGLQGVTNCEMYLAISQGLGGFPAGNVYATQGPNIYVLPPTGGTPTLFATLPTSPAFSVVGGVLSYENAHVSIALDTVGTFGYQMIVTAFTVEPGGPTAVYLINHFGGVSQLELNGTDTSGGGLSYVAEGPEIAPLSTPLYGGYLFLASESASALYAVAPNGTVTKIAMPGGSSPETVRFVPAATEPDGNSNPFSGAGWGNNNNSTECCTFGSNFQYFQADISAQRVVAFTTSELANYVGDAMVPDENSETIWDVKFTSSGVTVAPFVTDKDAIAPFFHEGGAMVHCPPPPCQCQCLACMLGLHQQCMNDQCKDQQCKQQQCPQQCQCQCLKCLQGDHQHCQNSQCHDSHCH